MFKEDLYTFECCPEHYLRNMILKNDIKYTFIKRFDNDNYEPRRIDDNLKLYHEHDMKNIIQLLKDRNIYSP